jgi:hypothetical protein
MQYVVTVAGVMAAVFSLISKKGCRFNSNAPASLSWYQYSFLLLGLLHTLKSFLEKQTGYSQVNIMRKTSALHLKSIMTTSRRRGSMSGVIWEQ